MKEEIRNKTRTLNSEKAQIIIIRFLTFQMILVSITHKRVRMSHQTDHFS
jgi:hypothetical protein